ncbi:hypothetical protein C8R45DRAFT_599671 [Mycena sanguinolenta]|nr:hypothetical protein C8R45DRAFT_599671 [Mycena sanguinolenta]
MTDEGSFVIPLINTILAKKEDLSQSKEIFLRTAQTTHAQLLKHLGAGADIESGLGAKAMFVWGKKYEEAASQFDGYLWLYELERQILPSDPKVYALIRYIEELIKPYAQFQFIRKAARKPFVSNVLHRSPQINVLPFPDVASGSHSAFQSMENFDDRVKTYLTAASESFLPRGGANEFRAEAISVYLRRIQRARAEGHLPALVAPHPACTLLRYHLDRSDVASSIPYPYIGASEPPSFQTALYFQAYNVCGLGPPLRTSSTMEVFPSFLLRSRVSGVDEAIENEIAVKLEAIFGRLLARMAVTLQEKSLNSIYTAPVPTHKVSFDTEKYIGKFHFCLTLFSDMFSDEFCAGRLGHDEIVSPREG